MPLPGQNLLQSGHNLVPVQRAYRLEEPQGWASWGGVGGEQGARGKVACTDLGMWQPVLVFFFCFSSCLLTSLLKAPAPVYNPCCGEKGPEGRALFPI